LGLNFFEPSVFVGCEDGVGVACQGENLLAFKHHVVFVGVKSHTRIGQGAPDLGVAGQCLRLIVVVGKDGLGL
jgi:hypothetical protein